MRRGAVVRHLHGIIGEWQALCSSPDYGYGRDEEGAECYSTTLMLFLPPNPLATDTPHE